MRGDVGWHVALPGVARQVMEVATDSLEFGVLPRHSGVVPDASAQSGGRGVVEQSGLEVGEQFQGDGLVGVFVVHLPKPGPPPGAAARRTRCDPVWGWKFVT